MGGIVAVLIVELVVITVMLSRTNLLNALRNRLGFRPSLVHVVELIISITATVTFFLTLGVFWQTWDESLTDRISHSAETRFNTLFTAAEVSTSERLTLISKAGAKLLEEGEYPPHIVANKLRELLIKKETLSTVIADTDTTNNKIEVAIINSDQNMIHSNQLETNVIERAFALAQNQVTSGLVSLDLRTSDDKLRHANILLSADSNSPHVLIIHSSLAAAIDFTFSSAIKHFEEIYPDPMSIISIPEVGTREHLHPFDNTQVLAKNSLAWMIKNKFGINQQNSFQPTHLQGAAGDTTVTLAPSENTLRQFSSVLHGIQDFRITMDYRYFFDSLSQIITISAALGLTILVALLWLSRFMVGGLVRPLGELTTVFENWRQFRGGEQGAEAALQAMDARELSSLEDIHSLQVSFRSLAQDVMYGEHRLLTIAANYDELLRSLPLGVLAVDGASRVQFINDALGEITEQRQDAIANLKVQTAQMLITNTTVGEWQLNFDDRPPKNLLLVVNHRLDDYGQESGLWVIVTDLTEQKQTNAQLIQASKLATLGEMSTGMAHELNQPLNVISLASNNLRFSVKKDRASPEVIIGKLDRIDSAVHRAASIIDHMRAYGRLAGEGLSEVNVGEIVQGAFNLLKEQLKLADITLINEVPEEGLMVKGNAIQLEQVLINLINNAKDAIREQGSSGKITVDCETTGGRVLIRVTDTGGGIPSHILPHIFEPFFTTKAVGKGTGLGGSISYGIIREMQGDIWVENVREGAQLTISLPILHGTGADNNESISR